MMTEFAANQKSHRNRPREKPKRGWKYFGFRLAALSLSLLPFLIFEIVARCAGWGTLNELNDPYIGFNENRPLFVSNEAGTKFETSPSRFPFFRPDSFAIEKPENEFRVFCLGGSTVQGRPYAIETAFSNWLELSLTAADPDRNWRIVNCGGVSYASYRMVPILEEVLEYEPDLIILYTGHNEFLEDRTYDRIKQVPKWTAMTHDRLSFLRTYNLARYWYAHAFEAPGPFPDSQDVPVLPTEVDAMLDYQGGLADYSRDPDWRRNVVSHFDSNLRLMVAIAKQSRVPIILVNPVCNLKDTPPFKSQNSEHLSDEELKDFETLLHQVKTDELASRQKQMERIQKALSIDEGFAELHFLLGQVQLLNDQPVEARKSLVRAKEEDICPLRLLDSMRDIIISVARETRTPCIDLQEFFDGLSKDNISGKEFLLDHVHPTIAGHQKIAGLLFEEIERSGWVRPHDQWKTQRDQSYRRHLEKLEPIYFETGKQRLEGLVRWTQGRSAKTRQEPSSKKEQE